MSMVEQTEARSSTLDVLCGTYDVLHTRGWTQDAYVDSAGRVCVAAAVSIAIDGSVTPRHLDASERSQYRAAKRILLRVSAGLPDWTPPTSLEQANNCACRSRMGAMEWIERSIIHEARAANPASLPE